MRWIFGAIGLVVGWVIGMLGNFAGTGMVIGALLGFGFGQLLEGKPKQGKPQEGASTRPPQDDWTRAASLAERVAHLEQQVATLTLQIQQLRAEPGVAPADSAASAQQTSAQPPHMPPVEAQPSALPPEPGSVEIAAPPPPIPGLRLQPMPAAAAVGTSTASVGAPATPEDSTVVPGGTPPGAAPPEPATPATPPQPPKPREPGVVDRTYHAARDWLLGGNTVVRVGIIVLFFGVAFLLKYAADNSLLPIEYRLAGVALGAIALLMTGWRIGTRKGAYGLVLQGGGGGILYLTVFAATKLYQLMPAGAAFPLMVAICALSAFLAVRQSAPSLAFMGSAGGFLAPVLLATGGGNHVVLFSYYALLNAGILAIAWYKAWRPLNLLGFVFTFSIGSVWGVTAYRPELLHSTEPFLILFFLMYVGIALLYAVRGEIALTHYVDGTLVFGTPIVTIGLQAALMKGIEFGLAWSAVAMAAFYLGVAAWLTPRRDRLGLLFESMLALAVIFATLAVPLAFSGPTTSAAWAIEGAAVTWLGVRQRRYVPFSFGLLMQAAAAGAFFVGWLTPSDPHRLPVLNSPYIATLLIALAGLFTGWWLNGRHEARAWHPWMNAVGLAAAAWGLLWWVGGGVNEILYYAQSRPDVNQDRLATDAMVLFAVFTAWLAHALCTRLPWALAEWSALALTPVLTLLVFGAFDLHSAPLTGPGWVAWPVAVVCGYLLLWRQQRGVDDRLLAPLHTVMFWNVCGLLALEGYWRLREYVPEGAWSWSAWAYGLGLMLLLVCTAGTRLRWPIMRFVQAYQVRGAVPLAALLWAWSIASVQSDGDASPLFWLPLLNPLDVAQLLVILAIAVWLRRLKAIGVQWHPRAFDYAALTTLFLWFNALMLRTLHHRFQAAYDVDAVLTSLGRQQFFLIGWSAFAFVGLWFARREGTMRLFAIASTPLIVVMWVWTFYANLFQDGGDWGRLPLLNPLDLVQAVIYAIIVLWLMRINRLGMPVGDLRVPLQVVASATAFLWLNTMLLRTLHHWANVPYTFDDMAHSTLVQASVSVFWAVCALAMTIWATRRGMRLLWFVGAALLAMTVIKLFLFDLSHVQGLERIVSFIGIGLMLLLIGYFSPLPPKNVGTQDTMGSNR